MKKQNLTLEQLLFNTIIGWYDDVQFDYRGIDDINKDIAGNSCIALDFKAAWKVYSEPYIELSKKYHIDIKIDAFEKYTKFSRHILIENGELKKDIEKHYDNYIWDCIMPKLGG